MVKSDAGGTDRKAELDNFHKVLLDISEGRATPAVRAFIVEAYVRGAISCGGSVENAGLEGNTAVFSRRSFRDRWNRNIVNEGLGCLVGTSSHAAAGMVGNAVLGEADSCDADPHAQS